MITSIKWPKILQTLLAAALACGVLVFLINGFFAHPWTDDYYYSALARDKGFFTAWHHHYTHFNGRYFSISLVLVNPLVYGQLWGYKVLPSLLILGLMTSILLIVSEFTREFLSIRTRLTFSLAILLVYLDQMPDIRPGLYWMSGSLTYQVGIIILFFFLALLLRLYNDGWQRPWWKLVPLLMLAGVLPGTNELLLFITLPMVCFSLGYDYTHQKKAIAPLCAALAVLAIGTCVALLAPGNTARLASYTGNRDSLLAVQQTVEAALSAILFWASTPLVLILTFVVTATVAKKPELKASFAKIPPIITASGLLFIMLACFFPPFWSTGLYPERRVVNISYLLFLVVWLLNTATIAARVTLSKTLFHGQTSTLNVIAYLASSGLLIILLFFSHSNLLLVTRDLLSGRSYRYDLELQKRNSNIQQSTLPHYEVEPLENIPTSLFFSDIDLTKEGWVNQSYAYYYGKESIVVKRRKP